MSDDLQARLDALPEWPGAWDATIGWHSDMRKAALARLALWHELAQAGDVRLVRHTDACAHHARDIGRCTCGRDLLLKVLEVPRD
jgi:hypothetical protein